MHAVGYLVDGAVVAELAAEDAQAAVPVDDVRLDGARLDTLVLAVRAAVRPYTSVTHLTDGGTDGALSDTRAGQPYKRHTFTQQSLARTRRTGLK